MSLAKTLVLSTFVFSYGAFATENYPPATYEVPVEESLKPYASFELKDFEHEVDEGQIEISYSLPPELVGREHARVQFKSQNREADPLILTGENGQASCKSDADLNLSCQVAYRNLQIDERGVQEFISLRSTSVTERDSRLAVAQRFSSEPLGVVRYRLNLNATKTRRD